MYPSCVISQHQVFTGNEKVFEADAGLSFHDFSKAAFKNLDIIYPKFYKMDHLCKLGFLAAEYLFSRTPDIRPDDSTAIVLGNCSSSLDSDIAHDRNMKQNLSGPAVFVYTLPNIVIGEIAIRHGIKGETSFFICEETGDPMIRSYAGYLIDSNLASGCLYGWVEYTKDDYLAKFFWMGKK